MDSNSESFFVLFIIFICVDLFIAIWLGMLFLISRFGGWNKLHKAYPFPERVQKPFLVRKFQSMQIGLSGYNGVMTLAYHPEGLGLEVMILFRFQHPKILIPWREIKLKEKSKSLFKWSKLEIGSPAIATISVNDKILEEINSYIAKKDTFDDRW